MSDVFFKELDLPKPDYDLRIGSGTHGQQTGRMMEATEKVLMKVEPDCVLVYGDTNSTLAGALTATKLHIPTAHIEAGVRSHNRIMPEEINRVVTDHVCDFLLAPTDVAVKNLRKEGIEKKKIWKVGDVMYDVAKHYADKAVTKSCILTKLGLRQNEYVLSTIHRAENTNDPRRLRAIFEGLTRVSRQIPVVMPIHPRTIRALKKIGMRNSADSTLCITKAIGYLDMVMLERNARLIATDSGGVQKEAFFYRVPCVTLRTETEWVELVHLGWNTVLYPSSSKAVANGILGNLDRKGKRAYPFGYGNACKKIVSLLANSAS
jgi:UDP-GlcNAc3NAcA epimerase